MLHTMRLHPAPFAGIADGTKTIELRLYDEKRKQIRVGDTICFVCTDDARASLTARVIALHVFDSFAALYRALPLLRCGYTPETLPHADPADMEAYYSHEEQAQYGVVGIELCLSDADAD